MLFFHKLVKCPFFEHFLKISCNFKILSCQNISSGAKTRNLDTRETLSSNEKQTCKLTTIIGQLPARKARRLKNCADELWKLARANTVLHLLTQKSEINL